MDDVERLVPRDPARRWLTNTLSSARSRSAGENRHELNSTYTQQDADSSGPTAPSAASEPETSRSPEKTEQQRPVQEERRCHQQQHHQEQQHQQQDQKQHPETSTQQQQHEQHSGLTEVQQVQQQQQRRLAQSDRTVMTVQQKQQLLTELRTQALETSTCCCGNINSRRGLVAIAIFYSAVSVIAFPVYAWLIFSVPFPSGPQRTFANLDYVNLVCLMLLPLQILCNTLLIVGSLRARPALLILWLINHKLSGGSAPWAVAVVVNLPLTLSMSLLIPYLFIGIYFFYVVRLCHFTMKHQRDVGRAHLRREMIVETLHRLSHIH